MLRTGNLRPGQKWKSSVIHEVIPVGVLSCNCSILGDEETGEAMSDRQLRDEGREL